MARLSFSEVEFIQEKEQRNEDKVFTRREEARERKRKLKKSEKRKLKDE